jgi:hypothetical protein
LCSTDGRHSKAAEHQGTAGNCPLNQKTSIDLFTVHCFLLCPPAATPIM